MAISITPLADRIVVEPLGEESTTQSGIIIPESDNKEKPQEGTVVAVGPGAIDDGERIPPSVKVGDRVLFSKYAPDEVEIGGTKYLIMREDAILAIIEN